MAARRQTVGELAPLLGREDFRRLADRLRHALEEHRFARVGKLSCSAGVASSPRDGMDSTELLAGAEQALGLAKKAGRRRTVQNGPGHTH